MTKRDWIRTHPSLFSALASAFTMLSFAAVELLRGSPEVSWRTILAAGGGVFVVIRIVAPSLGSDPDR